MCGNNRYAEAHCDGSRSRLLESFSGFGVRFVEVRGLVSGLVISSSRFGISGINSVIGFSRFGISGINSVIGFSRFGISGINSVIGFSRFGISGINSVIGFSRFGISGIKFGHRFL
jgi:hypothetical protein